MSQQPVNELTQSYRIKRTLLGFAFYAFCALFIGFATWRGLFPPLQLAVYTAGFITANGVFLILILSGRNLRFEDPNMTQAQIACAAVICSYILIYAGPLRGSFMLAYAVGLMFAGARMMTIRRLLRLAAFQVALFTGVLFIASHRFPTNFDWRVELVNWGALCIILGFTVILVGNLGNLQRRLKASNAELQSALARLTEMAVRDELTGLYNRRYLVDMLEREKSRADRDGGAFCVCVIDIDHFKRINDTYGHSVGDAVLRTFAQFAGGCIRSSDFLARWGGEEFLLLLPLTPLDYAASCVERIRAELGSVAFEGLAPGFRITISAGLAQYQAGGTIKELIERADSALYSAKRAGRNRIVKAGRD